MLKIDLHAHSFPIEYLERLHHYYPDEVELRDAQDGSRTAVWVKRRLPPVPVWDRDLRLTEIERDGVTLEVLSSPLMYTFVDEHSPELCRILNDSLAAASRAAPDRLRAFAHLPFNDMSSALAELSRAVDELGCVGVLVTSNLAGRYLHTPEFLPFWEEVNRRRLPVFLHPSDPPEHYDDETSTLLLFPYETTLSTVKLLYAGIFDRFPDLVLILSHLGGVLPFLARRIDLGFEADTFPPRYKQIERRPSDYMPKLYLDTALGWHRPAFECARELVGIEHMVYGSDHFMRGSKFRPWLDEFLGGLNLPPADLERVYGRNAEALLFR